MAKKVAVIKKYTNRRLYHTGESRYIKLDEIAEIIRQGSDIKVVDSQTDEDITKQILAQIILEEEKNRKDLLPTSLLYEIIRTNEEITRDFFENYLYKMMENYVSYRKMMDERLHEMTDMSKLSFELGDVLMQSFGLGGFGGGREDRRDRKL
jgi:polyhydroxyalkanoate synthesis repressor PhaR